MSDGITVPAYSSQQSSPEFTNISLESGNKPIKKKQPRRILHFSDGVLEEYSTDEEDDAPPLPPPVDPKTLTWGPWAWYYVATVGWKSLSVADMCGEKLAWFFGITTPKYQSAIDEFYRLKADEEKEKEYEERLKVEREGLSSVNVSFIDKAQDKAAGGDNVQKF